MVLCEYVIDRSVTANESGLVLIASPVINKSIYNNVGLFYCILQVGLDVKCFIIYYARTELYQKSLLVLQQNKPNTF